MTHRSCCTALALVLGLLWGCGHSSEQPPAAAPGPPSTPDETSLAQGKGRPPAQPARSAARPAQPAQPAQTKPPATKPPATKPPATKPAPPDQIQVEPAELAMPKVLLTEGHAKTCLVQVGDSMPSFELTDVGGKRHALESLRGQRMTVVVFWTAKNPYALEELADLGPDVIDRFGADGVGVVTIDEQDAPADVAKVQTRLGNRFPCLLDPHGAAFALVATRRLPRTYLLDAGGKILWFDIEYSRSTRRDLMRAIRFTLGE